MLQVNFKKKYDNFHLDINFTADKGITALLGPSGCGKSVSLRTIAGINGADSGFISLKDDKDDTVFYDSLSRINMPASARQVGYVFQNYALFPHLTVAQNICYGLNKLSKEHQKQKLNAMLQTIDMLDYGSHYPHEISGGQQQRVALARTLVTEPKLLLLDEPFSALDSHVKQSLEIELLRIIRETFTGTALLVTHNIEEAYRLSDNIVIISEGRTIQQGAKANIIHNPSSTEVARLLGYKNIIKNFNNPEQTICFRATDVMLYTSIQLDSIKNASNVIDNLYACRLQSVTEGISTRNIAVIADFNNISQEIIVEISINNFLVNAAGNFSAANEQDYYLHIPNEAIKLLSNNRKI